MIFKLGDGRTLQRECIKREDFYKMASGLIVKKLCSGCHEYIDVSRFTIKKLRDGTQHLNSRCQNCKKDYNREYAEGRRRRRGVKQMKYLELRFKSIDGLPHLRCNKCKKMKDLSRFSRKPNGHIREAICDACMRIKAQFNNYLSKCGKRFGKDSKLFGEIRALQHKRDKHSLNEVKVLWRKATILMPSEDGRKSGRKRRYSRFGMESLRLDAALNAENLSP